MKPATIRKMAAHCGEKAAVRQWQEVASRKPLKADQPRKETCDAVEQDCHTAKGINMTLKRQQVQKWIVAIAVISLLLLYGALRTRSGIQVTITNTGNAPIRLVVLHVTGNSYPLDDIVSGSSRKAIVKPTGESHLEIELIDKGGHPQRLNAGGYFEPGYCGSIDVSIKDGVIESNVGRMESN